MPIVTIQNPQGQSFQIEAPEGATDDQILRFAKSQGLFDQPAAPSGVDPEVPTEENLAVQPPAQQERTLAETAIGAGEAALSALTGATGGALGFLAATPDALLSELTGQVESGEGRKRAQALASSLTFQPRTEAGQEFVGDIATVAGALPPILTSTPLATLKPIVTGRAITDILTSTPLATLKPIVTGRAITDKLLRSPRAKRKLLAEEIRKGNPNIELVTKALNESGEIITRPASKRAVKILGGDEVAQGTVSVLENLNPASKSQVRKMLSIVEKGHKNPLFRDSNRPSDILGESILNRAKAISTQNKKAGKAIGAAAEQLKDVSVNISQPIDNFLNQLSDLGVTFTRAEDGWVTPNFSRSKFVGGSQKDMTVLINDLLNKTPDFNAAHKLKQTIRDNVDFDKGGTGQIKGASERMLKDLSRGIDEVLDSTSPKYRLANEKFAKTIALKDDFDKLAGKNIDIGSELSAKALGSKGMRLDSNAESRVHIEQTLLRADDVLKELGVTFKDDIPSLVHVAGKLNDAFKLAPSGSLKGNIVSGGLDVAEAAASPLGAARIAAQRLARGKDPDFNKKIRAFKSLVTEQEKK